MGIQSWKEEFYSVEAQDVPEKEAIAHCILKWEGLRKCNLRKHNVKVNQDNWGYIPIHADAETCALCHIYYHTLHKIKGKFPNNDIDIDKEYSKNIDKCINCPLYKVRGNVSCYLSLEFEEESPYSAYIDYGNAEPMLAWLRLAQVYPNILNQ